MDITLFMTIIDEDNASVKSTENKEITAQDDKKETAE
jgi:hypothetical protein